MNFKELLPVGSVVLLRNAYKKIVIIGVMPVRHIASGKDIAYDYVGVPYPEGYIGENSALFFNHSDIGEVAFTGYDNDERKTFISTMQTIIDRAHDIVESSK